MFIYIYKYIHGFRSLKTAVCKLEDWYIVDQTILRYRIETNLFGLILFFLCMDLLQVVYIIWTLKPVNDSRPANKMAFLVSTAGFAFEGHLSNWTIYDLKKQFSKLAA